MLEDKAQGKTEYENTSHQTASPAQIDNNKAAPSASRESGGEKNTQQSLSTRDLLRLMEFAIFRKQNDSFDVLHLAQLDASLVSARYYQQRMLKARNFPNDLEHLSFALAESPLTGLVLEFGVASGRTLNHIAQKRNMQTIYGFDVFTGLPETWRTGFEAGAFARTGFPLVRENCRLIPGLFEDTLPSFRIKNPGDIAFIHVDCDLYSGTRAILENCRDGIKPGTVICFDEYFNYPGYEQHEFKAWKQFCEANGVEYEYLGFVSSHQQVSVRVLSIS